MDRLVPILGQNIEASNVVIKTGNCQEQRWQQPGHKARQRTKAHSRIIGIYKLRRTGRSTWQAASVFPFTYLVSANEPGFAIKVLCSRMKGHHAAPADRLPQHNLLALGMAVIHQPGADIGPKRFGDGLAGC